jgi:hypothetical protein
MRLRRARVVLMTLSAGAVALFPNGARAQTTTAYEMFGGGTLTASTDSPGMGFGGGSDVNDWTFGDLQGNPGGLIIPGVGVLLGQPVAGTYDCSNSTVTTTGGAQNFTLDWTFICDKTQGVGPTPITGHFATPTDSQGSFVWPGYFQIGATGDIANATCAGGFVPRTTDLNSQRFTSVYFGGECTADPT